MSKVVEVVLPDELVADVEPALVQRGIDLDDYILEAVTWYMQYLPQEPRRPETATWADSHAEEQSRLLRRIHEELVPYTVEAVQAVLGEEEEDWEALLA
jgi:hypothetical protein